MLRKAVQEEGTFAEKRELKEIEDAFAAAGLRSYRVHAALRDIRSLGYATSHHTILSQQDVHIDADALSVIIASAPIDESLRKVAVKLLQVLVKYQLENYPLLASEIAVRNTSSLELSVRIG
jgi:hypothetical protein